MAANEAIIRAAGQRYAPQKFDYSGYIKGLASIASFLVEKKKATTSRLKNINKSIAATSSSMEGSALGPQAENGITKLRNELYQIQKKQGNTFAGSEKNLAYKLATRKKLNQIENIGKQVVSFDGVKKELVNEINNETLSDYGGAEWKNWVMNIADNESGINFMKIEDGVATFLNHKNEYVKFEELPTNIVTRKSSEKLHKKTNKNLDSYNKEMDKYTKSMSDYDALLKTDPSNAAVTKEESDIIKKNADKVMRRGIREIRSDIKDDNTFKSAAFDRVHELADGTEARFVDYYLSEGGMMDEELQRQFNDDLEKMISEGEIELDNVDKITEFKNLLVSDIIENDKDGNIKEDYIEFIKELYVRTPNLVKNLLTSESNPSKSSLRPPEILKKDKDGNYNVPDRVVNGVTMEWNGINWVKKQTNN